MSSFSFKPTSTNIFQYNLPGIGSDIETVCKLKNVPIWVFHGARDRIFPVAGAQKLVKQLEQCEGNILFTLYNDKAHDSWTQTYNNPQLYEWISQQKKE